MAESQKLLSNGEVFPHEPTLIYNKATYIQCNTIHNPLLRATAGGTRIDERWTLRKWETVDDWKTGCFIDVVKLLYYTSPLKVV